MKRLRTQEVCVRVSPRVRSAGFFFLGKRATFYEIADRDQWSGN